MKLSIIIEKLENAFPLEDAADWDFVGWQVRSKKKDNEISEILIALDVTESVIEEAIKNKIKLIIVHHPFIFAKSIATLANNKWKKELLRKLKANNINVYVLHTNFDKNRFGMNFLIAEQLKLAKIKYFDQEKLSVVGYYNNLSLAKVVANTKTYFDFDQVKVITKNLKAKINKVIVASGAAGDVVELLSKSDSTKNDISLVITGEVKWHQELEALDKNINVLVLGHNMEEKFVDFMSEFLVAKVFEQEKIKIQKYFFSKPIFC
ncbi:Nif3-like dinuclear metal center hexameric protein [Spiroplasma platyhelix]|uniref:GTP cyclohydrolase 1 type 2 homolog n=1 Tax=Spiroplasma platyhelix PALS-1 TaxID=1276218 RepID=A0A846U8R0_9MOLU|nr:Nif3-like dinuclear metal center hexameric protein [Spiroplasma platyhelix]MBE4703890.1 GTP cyclohydrolase 1 type 2 [Spiroplasma platyhelix PALS-1]NKE38263.1 Nif3-like dinuclear metal center hexameric protein [Spiroplasma platyhelix PALS-1]UJB29148.1 Nif3-like dinuclear metal center hexameric protein [Spiroplasma platyhelix PALS-1]